jgi:hypothetical protein
VEMKNFVLDPVGKARAFLQYGPQESITFYVEYTLEQLEGNPGDGIPDPRSA